MEKQDTKGLTFDQRKAKFGVFRPGKTAKDKTSGAVARRLDNRAKRVSWQQEGKARSNANFPREACNGKKNSRYTNS